MNLNIPPPDPWTLLGIIIGIAGLLLGKSTPPGRHRKTKKPKYRRGEKQK